MKNNVTLEYFVSYLNKSINFFERDCQTIENNLPQLRNLFAPCKSEGLADESFKLLQAVSDALYFLGEWIVMDLNLEFLLSRINREQFKEVAHKALWNMESLSDKYKDDMTRFFKILDKDFLSFILMFIPGHLEEHCIEDRYEDLSCVHNLLEARAIWEFQLIGLEFLQAVPSNLASMEITKVWASFDAELRKRPGALINFNSIRNWIEDFIIRYQDRFFFLLEDSEIEPYLLEEDQS